MRTKIIAANWKMNKTLQDVNEFLQSFQGFVSSETIRSRVIICPPAVYLSELNTHFSSSIIRIGAQNVSQFPSGAFTGEIAASMLASLEISYCIIGHSERRKYFNESNEMLKQKVDQLLQNLITPIFCCGEVMEERQSNHHFTVVQSQLRDALFHLSADDFKKIIIAYEPVWAIGTGINASPEQAQEMHAFIRKFIENQYGPSIANNIHILYGGSCNAANARELFSMPDVDGGLIGGASLKVQEFIQIIQSADEQ